MVKLTPFIESLYFFILYTAINHFISIGISKPRKSTTFSAKRISYWNETVCLDYTK